MGSGNSHLIKQRKKNFFFWKYRRCLSQNLFFYLQLLNCSCNCFLTASKRSLLQMIDNKKRQSKSKCELQTEFKTVFAK